MDISKIKLTLLLVKFIFYRVEYAWVIKIGEDVSNFRIL